MRLLLVSLLVASLDAQIITSQYDNARTGANTHETVLNPRNVDVKRFGRVFRLSVDGDVYAQSLYLPNLAIPGKGTHNVLFVTTEHDSVYAFDAAGMPKEPLWKVNFTDAEKGITTLPMESVHCPFLNPEVGITSTPVIDAQSGTLYVLVRTKESGHFWQRLHALDVRTGREKFGGPVVIRASVESRVKSLFGFGPPQTVEFLSLHENPRAALLLDRGTVYLTWGSSCDIGPYYGWVLAYDAHTLRQKGVLNIAPEAGLGGIWQSDTGPAADEEGNIYMITGNGAFNASSGGRDFGDSVIKLGFTNAGLAVKDYFTPSDQEQRNRTDADLGSGGPLLVPPQPGSRIRLLIAVGKGHELFVLDRERMGKFHLGNNRHALQTVRLGGGVFGAPAYWNGHVYVCAQNDVLRDFVIQNDRLASASEGEMHFINPGAVPTISAHGSQDGIVWLIETSRGNASEVPAVLHAYDAQNVAHELYNSQQNSGRDRAGAALHFTIPVVANGRVYVPASRELDVYGLLAPGNAQ
ncbi:MAG TPA: hypothetical protein VH369_19420 [Bryobacteraceae bacterium]